MSNQHEVIYTAQEWLPSQAGLGESPLYRASDDTLFFVDIKNQLLHIVPNAAGGWDQKRTLTFDEPITRLDLVRNRADLLAVQTKTGFAILDLSNGKLNRIANIHYAEDAGLDGRVRMNDGALDARGRWWAGSMALDEESNIGRLWCLDENLQVLDRSHGGESVVPNGPAFGPDDSVMYANETPQGQVFKYDYDVATGQATNRRLFVQMEKGAMPDGLAVDVEGHVWVAANGTGQVIRYSRDDGKPMAVCKVPGGKMCSCPVFGGKDMKTLFITSIATEESSGSVYRAQVDVEGIPRHEYRGKVQGFKSS